MRRVAAAAEIYPIETDGARNLNIRLLGAKDNKSRRDIVAEAVADGCRAAPLATTQHRHHGPCKMTQWTIYQFATGGAEKQTLTSREFCDDFDHYHCECQRANPAP